MDAREAITQLREIVLRITGQARKKVGEIVPFALHYQGVAPHIASALVHIVNKVPVDPWFITGSFPKTIPALMLPFFLNIYTTTINYISGSKLTFDGLLR